MILTDTHTHLYSEDFDADWDAVIERALKAGISRFFLPAIDASYSESMYALQRQYPQHIHLMAGLHPTHVKENYKEELKHISAALKIRKFVAIGEIGIDLYWDKSFLKQQQDAFQKQIQFAIDYHLPIIIHCSCLLYTSPSPRDRQKSRMPSSA